MFISNITLTVSKWLNCCKDSEYYAHLHMSAGDAEGNVFGGHLNTAIVSATCEMVITLIDGRVKRKFNDEVGLNLFDFA